MHTADQIRLRPPLFKSTCIRLRPPSVDPLQASALVHIFAAVPIQPQSTTVSRSQLLQAWSSVSVGATCFFHC